VLVNLVASSLEDSSLKGNGARLLSRSGIFLGSSSEDRRAIRLGYKHAAWPDKCSAYPSPAFLILRGVRAWRARCPITDEEVSPKAGLSAPRLGKFGAFYAAPASAKRAVSLNGEERKRAVPPASPDSDIVVAQGLFIFSKNLLDYYLYKY